MTTLNTNSVSTGASEEGGAASPVTANPWQALRQFTQARIALGRAGSSLPTNAQLEFQLAHARARDAVHLELDAQAIAGKLGVAVGGHAALQLHSAAGSRDIYLQRPDLGRQLDAASRALLAQHAGQQFDLALVIADGLSALAIEQNAVPLIEALLPRLAPDGWTLAPPVIVRQGRVAVGDEAGQLLGARAVLVLIGERPGLSSPDSLGLYLTWGPRVGLRDDSRNCISNVRPAGLSYGEAAYKLHYLLTQARLGGATGVTLKDETPAQGHELRLAAPGSQCNFLTG
jgi:ethanolamine ammonia-lyase small subunit